MVTILFVSTIVASLIVGFILGNIAGRRSHLWQTVLFWFLLLATTYVVIVAVEAINATLTVK